MSGPAPELLSAAQQGDKAAEERLLTENSRLIWSVVRRYLGRGVEQEDLYQLGCIGFLKAIQGFDWLMSPPASPFMKSGIQVS